jgi:hypothetical protein
MNRLIIVLIFIIPFTANSAHFQSKNRDKDPSCPSWNIKRFSTINNWFAIGVHESTTDGNFNYEVPISRKGVDVIWCAMYWTRNIKKDGCAQHIDYDTRPFKRYAGVASLGRSYVEFYDLEDQYTQYLAYSFETALREGVSGMNVGLALEYLSRFYFQEMTNLFPKEDFKITGGVEYKDSSNTRVLGELDIIVYNRRSCNVVALGESKAASKNSLARALKKARQQLNRFKNFIHNK